MSSAAGSRSPRAGAHRAPRAAPPGHGSRAGKASEGNVKTGAIGLRLLSKSAIARASALVVLAAVVGVGIAAGADTSPEPTVYNFLLDWQQGQYQQAAALTTGPPVQVASELASTYRQVDATSLVLRMDRVSQRGSTASVAFRAVIDLGSIGLQWEYEGQFTLREYGSTWKVIWSPSVIMPGLSAGQRLGAVLTQWRRQLILAADGQSLIPYGPTYEIGVIPDTLKAPASTVAGELAAVEPDLQAGAVAGQIEAAQTTRFQELVTLTPAQYARVAARIARIPGLRVVRKEQQLFGSLAPDVTGTVGTEIAAVLRQDGTPYSAGTTVGLSGLEQTYNRQLVGTTSTGVYVQDVHGDALSYAHAIGGVAYWPGQKPSPVYTTIDYRVQEAANQALAGLPNSATIVAVQPGTGQILAVASHQAPGVPALQPLSGQYEPGQAFTIVSAAALLRSGQVGPDSPEPCLPRSQVNGIWFTNDPAEPASLARASTVSKDFEVGCSSAFAELAYNLHASELENTAAQFGIGIPWQLPLSPNSYYQGSIGLLSAPDDIAADAIGQGGVRVSPLAMALAAAAAASGHWHAPVLVKGAPDPSEASKAIMSPQVLASLKSLMGQAVAHQAGLAGVGKGVYGQMGNAPFSRRGYRISWFVGYRGNVAFVVAELVSSSSDSAAPLAGAFLRNIHAGS